MNVIKKIFLMLIVLLFATASFFSQSKYQKNSHVNFNVSSTYKDYVIKYSFKDQSEKVRNFTLAYPKELTDKMIARFGIPQSMFKPFVVNADSIRIREKKLKEGLFKNEGDILCIDKSAMINFYAPVFCKPIAKAIYTELIKDNIDTRRQRIEMAMKFVQDIPYGIPNFDNDEWFYGGVSSPPQILLNMFGDCDSKTILFVGILIYLIDPQDIVFLKQPNHLLTGIKGNPLPGQTYVELDGGKYILAETAGPGRVLFGKKGAFFDNNTTIEKLNLEKNKYEFSIVPSYKLNPEVDKRLDSSNIKKNTITFSGGINTATGTDCYHLKIKNEYIKDILLLINFQDLSGVWRTKAWYNIKSGETAYIEDTKSRYFYFYAKSGNKYWGGDHKIIFNGAEFKTYKYLIESEKFIDFTLILK